MVVDSGRESWRIKDRVGDNDEGGKRLAGGEACRRIVKVYLSSCSERVSA